MQRRHARSTNIGVYACVEKILYDIVLATRYGCLEGGAEASVVCRVVGEWVVVEGGGGSGGHEGVEMDEL